MTFALNPAPGVRAVLFDAVGTLIYPSPPVVDVYHAAGARHGSRLGRDELANRFREAIARHAVAAPGTDAAVAADEQLDEASERRRWRAIVTRVFSDVASAEPLERLFETLWAHFADARHWRLFDDAVDAWRRLEADGYLLGVASNFDERLIEICRRLPPLDDCRRLFVSSQLGFAKPHPGFFRAVELSLHLLPEQILLVGDDPVNDLAGARAAGWHAALVERTH